VINALAYCAIALLTLEKFLLHTFQECSWFDNLK